ncbi:MAG TPA: O-antigen ligase family protein [Solirubrobacteraceae bacterium]|nr:O-antigen ligase family protein [Solirubrobacteraceae bacterium]
MATNINELTAKSLLFGDGAKRPERSESGARRSSIWPVLAPTVLVLALLLLATVYAGAFNVAQWAPPTIFVLLMLITLLLCGGTHRLPDRWLALALAGAWGLAGWAALSALWSGAPGAALEGAGRQAMYAAILTLPLVAVGDVRSLRMAGRGVVGGIAVIGLYILARMLFDGPSIFLAGRLNGPVEYRNATALLFCIAYWPLIVTAATRERARALRAVCFGLAVLMLGLAFLTQSRGVLIGLGCGGLVAGSLRPDRMRRIWLALLSVALLACASPWLLKPYHAFTSGHVPVSAGDIAAAGVALLVLVLASIALCFLFAVFDAGLRPASPQMMRVRAVARVGLLAVLLVLVLGGAVAVHGNPVHELQVKWREFKSLESTSSSAVRYTSTGGQRYDLWRVAALEFRSAPVGGVGEGSYEFGYYRLRRTERNLSDPHGLLFQLGAELGVVGLLLLAAILVGLVGSLKRWWRLAPIGARRGACGLTAAGATFLGQSLVDWIWRIPGLTALGVLCLGTAAALLARSAMAESASGAEEHERPEPTAEASLMQRVHSSGSGLGGGLPRLAWIPLALGLLVALALVLSLYLSDFYTRQARDELGHSPAGQLADARTASSLDPWSVEPHYLEASALESMGNRAAARAQLQDARRLLPESLVPLGLLGDFEARGGDYSQARVYYQRALALDPRDVGLQELARTGGQL